LKTEGQRKNRSEKFKKKTLARMTAALNSIPTSARLLSLPVLEEIQTEDNTYPQKTAQRTFIDLQIRFELLQAKN